MSKIACKMKNSYALDNQGNIFTWGSWESGLLGDESEADILRPNMVKLKYENSLFLADKISAGHFHAAVIANRVTNIKKKFELKYASNIFKKITVWFSSVFVRNVVNVSSFIKFMLKASDYVKQVKYEDFEKNFLKSFFEYQKINSKDIFKMKKSFENILREEFEMPMDKMEIEMTKLLKLEQTNNKDVKDLYNFALGCV